VSGCWSTAHGRLIWRGALSSIDVIGCRLAHSPTSVLDVCGQSGGCLCVVVSVGSMFCAEAGVAVPRLSGSFRSWSDCVVG